MTENEQEQSVPGESAAAVTPDDQYPGAADPDGDAEQAEGAAPTEPPGSAYETPEEDAATPYGEGGSEAEQDPATG